MKKIILNLLACYLVFLSFNAFAIQVNVKSSSKKITGLGFSVNGKKFGGLGTSYSKSDAPRGSYSFGIRAGKDIACPMADGKKTIKLKKNTTATLKYNGKKCKTLIS